MLSPPVRPEDQLEVRERPARPPGDHLGVLTGAADVPSPTSSFNHHTSSSLDAHIHERAEADYHYRTEYPMQDQPTPAQQRITALRTVADLIERHQLPAPMSIDFTNHSDASASVHLRLDDDTDAGVTYWGTRLGLGDTNRTDIKGEFTSVSAESCTSNWLGFNWIKVWSACDRKAGEQA